MKTRSILSLATLAMLSIDRLVLGLAILDATAVDALAGEKIKAPSAAGSFARIHSPPALTRWRIAVRLIRRVVLQCASWGSQAFKVRCDNGRTTEFTAQSCSSLVSELLLDARLGSRLACRLPRVVETAASLSDRGRARGFRAFRHHRQQNFQSAATFTTKPQAI
jgi:hypothetical protein